MNNAPEKKTKSRPSATAAPPVMSEIELARLGGGEVAYIKVLDVEEARQLFPGDRRLASRGAIVRSARGRRNADRSHGLASGGAQPCDGW